MAVVFRVAYSLAVAILYVLFVIFGSRTFYEEPDYPQYPPGPPYDPGVAGKEIYCNYDETDACYLNGVVITPEMEAGLTPNAKAYLEQQREYQRRQRAYEDDRKVYFRNVFIIAGLLGIAGIAAGLFLYRRVEAMPLGLLLGGLGAVIYGWVESSRGPEELGAAPLFAVATIGLIIVLAAGYWFLGVRRAPDNPA
jgi:hypothetical protein